MIKGAEALAEIDQVSPDCMLQNQELQVRVEKKLGN